MKNLLTLMFFVTYMASFAQEQSEETRIHHYNIDDDGIALSGYDAVSYFSEETKKVKYEKPKKGKKEFKYHYQGIDYLFSNDNNKNKFISNPSKFEPAYGGWCPYAMALGRKERINPKTYKIIDGKLYLFYNAYFYNALRKWNKNEAILKKKADESWDKIIKTSL